jgi:hypothetical protein
MPFRLIHICAHPVAKSHHVVQQSLSNHRFPRTADRLHLLHESVLLRNDRLLLHKYLFPSFERTCHGNASSEPATRIQNA